MTHPAHRGRGPLFPRDPFHELEELRARMDQLTRSTFPFPGGGFPGGGEEDAWAPPADVEDTEDAYVLELELPGVEKEQITVEVDGGELGVHGEIKERARTGVVRRRTRHVGRFDYRTTLPPNADTDHITADLADGILTVRVPKAAGTSPQRIEITD
ncbi:Hsp20/alpha crystallin family protein [Streptomyces tagetis]|uniref:Hsp20/alpha crystallin family protein n=1 Tax=Streptomyces tagetis TaxID=2820809 RepID=A0A941AWS3_9ACTN|nr:Hsp20/alpha crystallin family protein [Streptomyces sp. RG38]MBQ0825129.1 Hsp20/alpha crystallin family protein [Streptomyces sp. RG38]